MSLNPDQIIKWAIVAAGAAVLYGAYKTASFAKKTVTESLNPASDKNIVNQAVTNIGSAITDDENFSLGSKIYDWVHPSEGNDLITKINTNSGDY